MKKTIFLAAMISAFSITATFAQQAAPKKEGKEQGEKRGAPRGNRYEGLDLTKDQSDKLKIVDDEFRTKVQALREDKSLNAETRREKSMELRKARMEKQNTILTAEQKKKLEARMKERGDRGPRNQQREPKQ